MAGKTNTDKIDELNIICATLTARLDALLTEVRATASEHAETSTAVTAIKTQLAVVEVHVGGMAQMKAALETVTALEKEFALLKKDVEGLAKWREEQKGEKQERSRRFWSFGPNISAAIISAIVALAGIAINYWLQHH